MKFKRLLPILFASVLGVGCFTSLAIAKASNNVYTPTFATYTNGDADTYYNGISDSLTGDDLLSALQDLNKSKRHSTVGYSAMGTTPSGQFKYTDYDPNTVQYDGNGQPYGTRILSFYSGNSTTSFNREHVWPKSHGGNQVESDIHMPRPTIQSENGSRGNSFYVEGKCDGSNGWDPAMEDFGDETYRGDSARIIFYCMVAYDGYTLLEADSHTTSNNNRDNMMGRLSHMVKWNLNYPVTQREMNRNEGAEYLQGNRNPFIDHPEYVCRIWGNANSETQKLCAASSIGITSISSTSMEIAEGNTSNISASSSNGGQISWESSDPSVCSVSASTSSSGSSITLTAHAAGNATITASITISGTKYTKTCAVTVTDPKTLSSITVNNSKTSYTVGDTFIKPTVIAHYSDSSTSDVSSSAIFSGYNMNTKGSQTVTVSYTEGGHTEYTSYTISVSESSGNYQKVTSTEEITDGDYLIVYESESVALNSALTTDQTSNTISVTINDGTIESNSTTDAAAFTIEASSGTMLGTGGSYVYHTGSSNSLNYTTTKSSAENTLSISGGNFVVQSGSYYLRYNNNDGQKRFRFYKSGLQDIQLYKKSGGQTGLEYVVDLDLTISKLTYNPGDYFDATTFSVTAITNQSNEWEVSFADLTFSCGNHMFTYEETGYVPCTVSYQGVTKDFGVYVERNPYETPVSTEVENFSITGTKLKNKGVDGSSSSGAKDYNNLEINDVIFSATNIYTYEKNSIRYISFGKNYGGEIHNVTPFVNPLSSITLDQLEGSRQDGVISVSEDGKTYLPYADVDLDQVDCFYFKVEYDGVNTSLHSNFNIDYALVVPGEETALNVSNYIMYEDIENQCLTKLDIALGYYRNLNDSQKNVFCYSDDYVIESARDRLEAWAKHLNKEIDYENGTANAIDSFDIKNNSNGYIVIVIISSSLLTIMFGSLFILKKKRTNK